MSVSLEDVRLARKRAYDRVDYWLQKYQGVTIHEAGISIPRIPKDLKPSEYGEWFDYFENFTGAEEHGATEDYVFDEYEPPEREEEYPEPEEPEPKPEEDEYPDEDWWDDWESDGGTYDNDWWEYEDEIAPDYVSKEKEIIDDAYDISGEAGDLISEALNNIKEQFENVGDMESYESGLDGVIKNSHLWDDLRRAEQYRHQIASGLMNLHKSQDTAMSLSDAYAHAAWEIEGELTHALQRLYKHFGMTYVREY